MVLYERTFPISACKAELPYCSLLTLNAAGFKCGNSLSVTEDGGLELNLDGVILDNDVTIARFIAQSSGKSDLFGKDLFEQAKIDEVLVAAEKAWAGQSCPKEVFANVQFSKDGTLFEKRRTVADFALFALLAAKEELKKSFSALFQAVIADPRLFEAHTMVGRFEVQKPKPSNDGAKPKEKQKDEGKFVDLPGAEKGKVVVRFPPEASGYLHIGHAKAALLNQFYQQNWDGKLIMRFDDTNPAKENAHFEEVIKEDLKMLEIKPDIWSHSSDHFELMLELCEKLLKEGKAYVDDTDMETMRKEREERVESKNRNTAPEANLKLWEEMKKGTTRGLQCCVRIKMDMKSNNGAMRDPTIYRCKLEEHVRTGTKYKVYPTYDFACPIVDSIEGVTHTLRTTEYHDRDDQFYFFCDALGLRKPHIWEYSRLNMTNTVMSKRKLTWFVEEGVVEGWDDPRFPTVRGVLRRGLTVEGLKQFIVAQGGSRSVVMMEWDKIWAFNKKVIDPVAPRYTALDTSKKLVTVNLESPIQEYSADVQLHPKNAEIGTKKIFHSSKILIEQVDAQTIKKGDTVTFVNWGNLQITDVKKQGDEIVSLTAKLDLDNKDYKKTLKVTWIADVASPSTIPVVAVEYDHIINKAIIGKDEDWKNFINYDSVHYTQMRGEPALKGLKKGSIIQIQRKGFFICDHEHVEKSPFTDKETPLLLIAIPDGSQKDQGAAAQSTKDKSAPASSSPASGVDPLALYEGLERQGAVVRDLKGKDAKSQATKDAIAQLLKLKTEFKEKTGQDYKSGSPPAAAAPKAATAGASDPLALYEALERQGALVRDLKGKDAKSQATKDAIAQLLKLKTDFKEKTGQDYKAGSPPAAAASTVAPAVAATSDSSDPLALYEALERQGALVRDLKGKDAKSQATKDAIAQLLSLKTVFKQRTGQDYKAGSPPTISTPSAPAPPAASSSSADPLALFNELEKQGALVRDLKGKDAKSETKDAIAKLLKLKVDYKEKLGEEYKAGTPPAGKGTSAAAPAPSNALALYEELEKQGALVRELKGKDAKSQATKDAIAKLLKLKEGFKATTGQDYKSGTPPK
ncbi:unnamed protein product, partial [Mesorhabditis spiculigera]